MRGRRPDPKGFGKPLGSLSGLADYVEIREGNALDTLRDLDF